ncbi:hypothetical protein DPMN_090961 [Dreissena polymorpha]|uniref:Uncharacterized protein n=1 Tax=Dreissena polymorpha TaxID=45954 RepID=A0A9D4QZJ0_DREPO|nr:hypothetical protein DPMN_090961 [Dreissena polymorpha]
MTYSYIIIKSIGQPNGSNVRNVSYMVSPFLTAGKREMLADYALPAAVLIM